MIGCLRGQVLEVELETVLIDCQGVGYEVFCSTLTLSDLEPFINKQVTLWIYTHVREDQLTLFGFLDRKDKEFFLSLLKVNGIGPKLAIHALSGARADQIVQMIENEEIKKLTSLPKVGKKIAEQMILTLKGKLVLADKASSISKPHHEVQSALINLGYRQPQVDKIISQLPKDLSFEESVKLALQHLSGIN